MNADDVEYKICATQMMLNNKWKTHHFALAAANTVNMDMKQPAMTITDVDIDMIYIQVPD